MSKRLGLFFSLIFSFVVINKISAVSLNEFIKEVYLQQKDDSQLYELYLAVKPNLKTNYDIALLNYYMARAYQSFDTIAVATAHNKAMRKGRFISLFDFYSARKEAIDYYELSLEFIKKELDSYTKDVAKDENYAQFLALKADSISQLCLLKSLSYTVGNGLSVARFAKEVLSIIPNDNRAKMLIASSKIYPPKIYGGDPQDGIKLLNEISLTDIGDEERFNIYSGYGYCYARLGQKTNALSYIQKALDIYPTNIFLLALKKMVQEDSF